MKELHIYKLGGKVISDEKKLTRFLEIFVQDKSEKILVHGGGSLANKVLMTMGIKPHQVKGRRITNSESLDVVTMVYAGLVNKKIVSKLQAQGCNALGLSGADANSIEAVKRPVLDIDYGYVGDITNVNEAALLQFVSSGYTPVLCALTHDTQGQLLNTNADTVAAEVARALTQSRSVTVYYYFDFDGVLLDKEDPKSVIPEITQYQFEDYIEKGIISDGMIPKLENAFRTVSRAHHVFLCGEGSFSGDYLMTKIS